MKLKNTETNQVTKIKNDEFGNLDLSGAADTLVKRIKPGHFATGINYYEDRLIKNKNTDYEIELEICRPCGDLVEHTEKKITLTMID